MLQESIWQTTSPNKRDSAVNFATDSRLHVSVNVQNLAKSVPFYQRFFGENPTKVREGFAKFEIAEPALNFTLNEHPNNISKLEGHFGVQVKSTKFVEEAFGRLQEGGFKIITEDGVECCYALQTKIWVADPDGNRWEVFVVTEAEAEEGCGPDCICYQDFERSYVTSP
jgi:catechol 2,3-dioxygenase-like lactoylglutathione lyase family enzyme